MGSDRKTTGSYYTPPDLVHELIQSALVPVIEDRLKAARTAEDKERALLGLRVCDPASGSGHFLLAAARRIARELAKVRSGEAEPSPVEYRTALRDVIRSCIYAVDKKPLAVDLCKVALWLEGHNAGLPLSFLDHHVKCGDSLVGVFDLDVLTTGIPDEAYTAVTGDDKVTATAIKKRNKIEREGATPTRGATARAGQYGMDTLAAVHPHDAPRELAGTFAALAEQEERTPDDVRAKEALYEELRGRGGRWWTYKVACDLWTAAFFSPLRAADGARRDLVPTTDTVRRFLAQPYAVHGQVVGEAQGLAQRLRFFQWPLEFPEVFAEGGFDVVLGNPPWERNKLQEQEFFAARDPEIAHPPNKAARQRLIDTLPKRHPELAREFDEAKHAAEAQSMFVRGSGRFPLCGRGDVNTYSIFAETMRTVLGPTGRAGVIVPSGIATDDTTKFFFSDLMDRRALASLFSFENEEFIFPAVHHATKFCLLTIDGSNRAVESGAEFAFFLRQAEHLRDPERRFVLTAEDMVLLNPNTRTCPIFRSRRDAELTRAIYRRVPVLIKEGPPEENPWGIRFATLFHMSNDSNLFWTREALEGQGARMEGNVFVHGNECYVPLYEGKMIWHFDHRWATYDGLDTRDFTTEEKADPRTVVLPRYWVPVAEVQARVAGRWERDWLLGWRDITSTKNERTVIDGVLPRVGMGNKIPLIQIDDAEPNLIAALSANLSAFVYDYAARQKIGGTTLNFFIYKQLPVLPPKAYERGCSWTGRGQVESFIRPRVLELTYTAWDLAPFAHDLGYDGPPFRWDEARRSLLRCELDAAFFHRYGIAREDVDYIMDTFAIVRRKDEAAHSDYRTKRVILEIYDEMARATAGGSPYQTRLDPPPADPRVAHGPRE